MHGGLIVNSQRALYLVETGPVDSRTTSRPFGLVLATVLAGLLVTALRAAASWRPGSSWRLPLSTAAEDAVRDRPGSLMIAAAVLVMALIVIQAPAFAVIAPGLLSSPPSPLPVEPNSPPRRLPGAAVTARKVMGEGQLLSCRT